MTIDSTRAIRLFGLAFLVGLALLVPGQAAAATTHHRLDTGGGTRAFWTKERMENAVSLDAPRATLPEVGAKQGALPSFLSQPVPNPSLSPYPAAGKVFFELGRNIYVCSAAIVDSPGGSLVWTAAHCVRDAGRHGTWASRWIFVPGYDAGAKPHGKWAAKTVAITKGWYRGNDHFDFAAAVIAPRNGNRIEDAVGEALPFGSSPAYDQTWVAVGYPEANRWHQQMWQCVSDFYRRDSFRGSGPDPIGIGCDMGGGSSGGPWISETGALGAVTSYAYTREPDALYGTYLGSGAQKLYDQLRHKH